VIRAVLVDNRLAQFRGTGEFQHVVEIADSRRADARRTAMQCAVGSVGSLRECWPVRKQNTAEAAA
jgi:hypothetical protein